MRFLIFILFWSYSFSLLAKPECIEAFYPRAFKNSLLIQKTAALALPKSLTRLKDDYAKNSRGFLKRLGYIKGRKIDLPPQIKKFDEIQLSPSSSFRPLSDAKLIERFNELDKKMQKAIIKVYNTLNDPAKVSKYLQDLYIESFHYSIQRSRGNRGVLLQTGNIKESTIALTLIKRFKRRNEYGFTTITRGDNGNYLKAGSAKVEREITSNQNNSFRFAVARGPFIDNGFENSWSGGHGAFSHMLQRDLVYPELAKIFGNDVSTFYQYLGSKKGISFWADLFDSGVENSFARPEYVTEIVGQQLLESF